MEKNKNLKIFIAFAFLIFLMIISLFIGRYGISAREIFLAMIGKENNERAMIILFGIRLPRVLLAVMVGFCLSSAGAVYQGVFHNPMSSPDILGASNGAAFGAALAILMGFSGNAVTAFAFGFGLLTVGIIYVISERAHDKKAVTLILCGIMISSLFSAGTSFIKLVADPSDQLPAITYWLMGSLSGAKLEQVAYAAIPMAVGLLPMFLLRWRINILTLEDDESRALGVDTKRLRFIMIICSTLVTAASVSVSGMIGWVGLVIPHMARKLVGCNYKYLLPASAILGGSFLLLVDNVSRNLFATEIPIGILTAVIGAPFFISMILRKENLY